MQGAERVDRQLLDAAALVGHLVPDGSVFAFLARHRGEVFPAELFADLFPSETGRPSLPGEVAASVLVLQALGDLSDRDAVAAVRCDLRWKVACGLPLDHEGFHPTTLTYWRRRLAASDRPDRIFEAVRSVVAATGVLGGKTMRALDSVVLDDAVVILSLTVDHGCDLGVCVVNGVADAAWPAAAVAAAGARLLSRCCRRGAGIGVPGRAGAQVTQGVGELPPEPVVLLSQLAVAVAGFGEPPQQGCFGGSLASRDCRGWRPLGDFAEALDLVADVGLGIQPRARDPGGAGDSCEGDGGSGVVEFAQGADGLGAGQLVAPACRVDERGGVVRTHRLPPAAGCRRRLRAW
jgi:hypothetical protein